MILRGHSPRPERRRSYKRFYAWGAFTVFMIGGAIVTGIWLLAIQTENLKQAAQEAACLSIANQNIQFTAATGRPPPLDIRLVCDGATERQIVAKVIHDGGIK